MSLQFEIKRFNELSLPELYRVLQLRNEVFIVEQNCPYPDLDDKDGKALHLLGIYNDGIVAYCRLFGPGEYFDNSSIGRVVVSAAHRNKKWGHILMQEAIKSVHDAYGDKAITISAQLYLEKFYQSHGFVSVGESYLEDDIPHIRMEKL